MYQNAELEIRDSVVAISNKFELGKKDTVAILSYLLHDIMSIRENEPNLFNADPCPFWNMDHGCHYNGDLTCHETPCKKRD
jgi:hypothetical protein